MSKLLKEFDALVKDGTTDLERQELLAVLCAIQFGKPRPALETTIAKKFWDLESGENGTAP